MSISWGAQYPKLKTNLRLAINRLQLLGKKKTEMAMKARTEIAEYISANKPDRARIRVEHIIREDYVVEAFEILEMYCDLLLARFGLIEQMKTLDDGIAEAVISILWAAPRLATDIAEFKTISDQLTVKYGKPFAEAARGNQLEFPARVNPKIIAKLGASAPPKLLVERYMIEIAAAAGLPFVPDADVMREDEVHQAEQILIDYKNAGIGGGAVPVLPTPTLPSPYGNDGGNPNQGGGGGSGGGGSAIGGGVGVGGSGYGWNLENGAPQGIGSGIAPNQQIGGGVLPNVPVNRGGGGGPAYAPPNPPTDSRFVDDEHIYDHIPGEAGNIYEVPSRGHYDYPPDVSTQTSNPGVINLPKIGPDGMPIFSNNGGGSYPALSQRNSLIQPQLPPNHPSAPPQSLKKPDNFEDFSFPEPPTTFIGGNKPGGNGGGYPGSSGGNNGGNGGDLDFDDLAKRFDALKKRNN